MKKLILIFLYSSSLISQTDVIDVTTTGAGSTKEDATKNALRNALESSFGAFISSKTEIVNDEIVNDEITSISSGNIVSYEIVSTLVEENNHFVTVNSQVSLVKFSNYIQSKGHNVTFNGDSFAMNEKVQKFNRVSEEKTIKNILTIFEDKLKKSIEFKITVTGNPKLSNNKELRFRFRTKLNLQKNIDMYELKASITWGVNDNFSESFEFLFESLESLSMKKNEMEYYLKINRDIFPIYLTDQVLKSVYNYKLREATTLEDISSMISRDSSLRTTVMASEVKYLNSFSGLNIFLRSKKSMNKLLNSLGKIQSFIYNFKVEFGIGDFYPSKYLKIPTYKNLQIVDEGNLFNFLNGQLRPSELINQYENDFISIFKVSSSVLPRIVTSNTVHGFAIANYKYYDFPSRMPSGITDKLLVQQEIQNLIKSEVELGLNSSDVNVLDMDFQQYINYKSKKESSLKNQTNNSKSNIKERFPKLVLFPVINKLHTGGFNHNFFLFLTLENLDKIKDFRIINLN